MAVRDDLQWVEISDFSPGIVDAERLDAGGDVDATVDFGGYAPLGSAREAQGCLASPTGSLIPGWNIAETVTETADRNNWGSGYRPTDYPRQWCTGTALISPITTHDPFPASGSSTLGSNISAGATSLTVASATGFAIGDRIMINQGVNTEFRILTNVVGTTLSWSGGTSNGYTTPGTTVSVTHKYLGTSVVDEETPDALGIERQEFYDAANTSLYNKYTAIRIYNRSHTTPTEYSSSASADAAYYVGTDWRRIGGCGVVGVSGTHNGGAPPPTATWTTTSEALRPFMTFLTHLGVGGTYDVTWPYPVTASYTTNFLTGQHLRWRTMVYHDRRTVGIPVLPQGGGWIAAVGGGTVSLAYQGNLTLEYTGPLRGVASAYSQFGDYPTTPLTSITDGSGTLVVDTALNPAVQLVSINAQTLLVICDNLGGYLLRGVIEKPSITQLTALPPARGRVSIPVVTPLGIIYGTRDGVFVVGEDGTSEKISANLAPEFWVPGDAGEIFNPLSAIGKFNYVHPYVICPNNYLYNVESGSWWRMWTSSVATASPYSHYEVSATGQVYAVCQYQTSVETTVFRRFDPNTPLTSNTIGYDWKSNPIRELSAANARETKIRALEITGVGFGDVTVTLNVNYTGASYTHTFTFESLNAQTLRVPVNLANMFTGSSDGHGPGAFTVDISSVGDTVTDKSPTVQAIRIGYAVGHSASVDA